jgi:dTDP-4-amino-4,6-dideoxygalactose transaminase
MIPYTKHLVENDDIDAVVRVLKSDRLTQGSTVTDFETAISEICGTKYAVACSSGTAALYLMFETLDRDCVAVPALTFIATAAAAYHAGCEIVVEDIDDETLCMRASAHFGIIVDYAGYATPHGGQVAYDAAHSFGARKADGSESFMAAFSFHPAKTIATGEGGAVVTSDAEAAERMRQIRNHGRRHTGLALHAGWNFRMSDIHAALGLSQAAKVSRFVTRRRQIAHTYLRELANLPIRLPHALEPHAWHLFVVRISSVTARDRFREYLRDAGIGTQIHYPLVYEHGAFKRLRPHGGCPIAEKVAREVVSIPLSHAMTDLEVEQVISGVCEAARMAL